MPRPQIRNIEIDEKAEAFLSGVDSAAPDSRPAAEKTTAKRNRKTPTLAVAPAAVAPATVAPVASVVEQEPTKKWTAAFHLSTIDLIERRFHEYYTPDQGRLSKRDLVEALLGDALRDDKRVREVLGPVPVPGQK
jgi:hypothetical protein